MWSSVLDSQLIATVKSYPCLYDLRNAQYNDKAEKDAVWTNIGHLLSVSGDYAKHRWVTLRKRYRKYRRMGQRPNHLGANGKTLQNKWTHYPLLDDFLHSHLKRYTRRGPNSAKPNTRSVGASSQHVSADTPDQQGEVVEGTDEVVGYKSPQWEPENVLVPGTPVAGQEGSGGSDRPNSSASDFSDLSDWGSGNSAVNDVAVAKANGNVLSNESTQPNHSNATSSQSKKSKRDSSKISRNEEAIDPLLEIETSVEGEEDTFAKTVALILKNIKKRDARKCSMTRIKILQLLHESQFGNT
ncbi:hypothetical protein Pmani_001198 [Petrolisthes manimaculis]|uniref:MADF domain-containing protein n=1 Tax=Petrolisthes manimaculis TaxID=1843537 RepID=A0AAE1ULL4_9EUCA|nr:hypothetical protein Pmani_001198 [Petrolisthes manimaculis]